MQGPDNLCLVPTMTTGRLKRLLLKLRYEKSIHRVFETGKLK